MTDREKVIKGLEWALENMIDPMNDFRFAGYDGPIVLLNEPIVRDTLALLKAQEPRVISWQDAESMRLCWLETRFPHSISPADLIHYFDESPNITVFKIHQNAMDWPLDEYGIKWRCWNNEPTNEQMNEVKWDG